MIVHPSRHLNERAGFLGLSIWDLAVLAYFLVLSQSVLASFHVDWIAFLATLFVGYVLVSVRLKFRPKAIRDAAKFQLSSRGIL